MLISAVVFLRDERKKQNVETANTLLKVLVIFTIDFSDNVISLRIFHKELLSLCFWWLFRRIIWDKYQWQSKI